VKFYLGAHQPGWLEHANFPLFVSHTRMATRLERLLPVAQEPWALDSGAFSELQRHGRWVTNQDRYVRRAHHYMWNIGQMEWAAPMDWMCEPAVIHGGTFNGVKFAGTGLSVAEHQRRTVANLLSLREEAPEVPWIPVLQGWTLVDYLRCTGAVRGRRGPAGSRAAGGPGQCLPTPGDRRDRGDHARAGRHGPQAARLWRQDPGPPQVRPAPRLGRLDGLEHPRQGRQGLRQLAQDRGQLHGIRQRMAQPRAAGSSIKIGGDLRGRADGSALAGSG
jgi:hypothetical protein